MQNKLTNKKVIVTGASGGIGERLVWHIARHGGVPIMLARSMDQMRQHQEFLKQTFQSESFVYQVDLQNEKETDAVLKQIIKEHGQIHGLINNAGLGIFDLVKDMQWQDVERMFQLNVFALMRVTQQLLDHFSYYQKGHIVNIASQAGKLATPKSSAYAATKHAVLGFTNALRLEAVKEGVQVTAVNLGPVRTSFFKTADPEGAYQKNVAQYMLDPDYVAQKVVRHLFTNKREINLPNWMEMGSALHRLFPNTMERLLKKQFNKKY
ncbi:MAG TPA: SDR family oxidoreductase [Virgibacillus sp.]|nr:SDR family oxidoreductase [Virgibacillus sp.]